MPIDDTYKYKVGQESIPEYNSRIAAYNASKTALSPAPAAPSGSPTSAPSSSDYYPRYTSAEQSADTYLNNFQAPRSVEDIQQEKMRGAQGEIDTLNRLYDSKLSEQKIINEGRSRGTSSVNTLSGLAGSTEANIQTERTDKFNKADNDRIQNERAVAIQGVLGQVRASAVEEAQQSRLEARQSAQDILANRAKRQEAAANDLTLLAQSGVTLEGLKQSDPESYAYFARNIGEDKLSALMTLNRPQDTILDKKIQGGQYIISFMNPLNGKVRVETVDLGLPPEYTQSVDAGNRLLFIPDGWDGDTSKLVAINKGLTPSQAADAGAAATNPGAIVDASGKPIKLTATQVDTVTGFDNTSRAANEALALLKKGVKTGPISGSILQGNKFRDAADGDQLKLEQTLSQMKAAYMKALSGAAVSEQEVKRLSKFLPDIYDQEGVLTSKLESLINDSTQRKSGFLSTLGASGGTTSTGMQRATVLTSPNGQTFDASDLSDSEYQQAIDDGYRPQ